MLCDFIVNRLGKPSPILDVEGRVVQPLGDLYQVVSIPEENAYPINLERYSYEEIPHCYTLLGISSLQQAGILQMQTYPGLELTGEGVMIGFVDTGIDYQNPIFRNLDGTTRIVGLWDQTQDGASPPEGFAYGTEFQEEQLNQSMDHAITEDANSHGTFLASIAAGGATDAFPFIGAAPECSIGVVKLRPAKSYLREYYFISDDAECYQENDIMAGVVYLDQLARSRKIPLVLCLALGTNQGSHNGTSPLDGLLELLANTGNRVVVLGAGNEANARHHYLGELETAADMKKVEIQVDEGARGVYLELWTSIPNVLEIAIQSPTGEQIRAANIRRGVTEVYRFILEGTVVTIDYDLLSTNSNAELIVLRIDGPTEGLWNVLVRPILVGNGVFHMWLPISEFLSNDVFFLESSSQNTITEPGNLISGITVGYYNGGNNSVAISSGKGYTREGRVKPDLVAPGIDVEGVNGQGNLATRSGSSLAVGITTGAVALLVEWIAYRQQQGAITAMQARNLLVLGTQKRVGETYPNMEWGYGQLNLYETFEVIKRL